MIILALDSSSKTASCAVSRDGVIIASLCQNLGLTHSETLLPMVDLTLKAAKLELKDINLLAVTNGPGSFTGLRIGVSTALGLSAGAGIECLGISSLEALAATASVDGLICPLMDARRGEVYNALFKREKGLLKRITPDRALPLKEVLEEAGRDAVLVWDTPEKAEMPPQTAAGAAICAHEGFTRPVLPLCYLRKPQAERERDEKGLSV